MPRINDLQSEEFEQLILPIWTFLAIADRPEPADVIFVFGGTDLNVPRHAAILFSDGLAPVVLVTGSRGKLTQELFLAEEASVFVNYMQRLGVPADAIIIEEQATHAGENVAFGMEKLRHADTDVHKALLVAKPFLMRRCVATFEKQYPDVHSLACPPPGPPLLFINRPPYRFAARLIAELTRLENYDASGFITTQSIPDEVEDAARRILAFSDVREFLQENDV